MLASQIARRPLLSGKVVFSNKSCVLDCTVRELSPKGAVISLNNTLRVPQVFELRIPSLSIKYPCETASRTLTEIRLNIVQ
jgi:hypothetical protein